MVNSDKVRDWRRKQFRTLGQLEIMVLNFEAQTRAKIGNDSVMNGTYMR
jgi:hypothetical protein